MQRRKYQDGGTIGDLGPRSRAAISGYPDVFDDKGRFVGSDEARFALEEMNLFEGGSLPRYGERYSHRNGYVEDDWGQKEHSLFREILPVIREVYERNVDDYEGVRSPPDEGEIEAIAQAFVRDYHRGTASDWEQGEFPYAIGHQTRDYRAGESHNFNARLDAASWAAAKLGTPDYGVSEFDDYTPGQYKNGGPVKNRLLSALAKKYQDGGGVSPQGRSGYDVGIYKDILNTYGDSYGNDTDRLARMLAQDVQEGNAFNGRFAAYLRSQGLSDLEIDQTINAAAETTYGRVGTGK